MPFSNGRIGKTGMKEGVTAATGVTTAVRTDETEGMTEETITGVIVKIEVITEIAVMNETAVMIEETIAILIAVGSIQPTKRDMCGEVAGFSAKLTALCVCRTEE